MRPRRDGPAQVDSRLVLTIEDSDTDARLIREGLKQGYPAVVVEVWKDGATAIHRIRSRPPCDEGRPDLILLDWNLPGMHGSDVLRDLKNDNQLRSIPIVVLNGSAVPADVTSAYACFANCYVQKPVVLGDFLAVIAGIARFWLTVAELTRCPPYKDV